MAAGTQLSAVRDARAARRRFDDWGTALPGDAPAEDGDDIEIVDIEVVDGPRGALADDEEVAVTGQAAMAGVAYFDDGPVTHQVVTRAVAARQDLAVRTQALASRAPDLLARLGDLRDDIEVIEPTVVEPTVVATPAPAQPTPEPVATDSTESDGEVLEVIDPVDAVRALRSLAMLLDEGRIDRDAFDLRKAYILGRV